MWFSVPCVLLLVFHLSVTLADVSISASDPIQKPGTARCVGTHCTAEYFYYSPSLAVVSLTPNSGPITGGTQVIIRGSGFRNFGRLMKCKFGEIQVQAKLQTLYGEVFNPYNGDTLVCEAPAVSVAKAVAVEVTLTGDTYTTNGILFTYYNQPVITAITNTNGTNNGEEMTIIGSGFNKTLLNINVNLLCRFRTPVVPNGNAQVLLDAKAPATLHSDSEITCNTPATSIHGAVYVSVAINGQDFTTESSTISFNYTDNWRTVTASGTSPYHREFHTGNLVGCTNFSQRDFSSCRMVLFGGWSGDFLNDIFVLYLDVFKDYYPSTVSQDWAWSEFTTLDLGDTLNGRAKHKSVVVGDDIYIYGGIKDWTSDSINEMYRIDKNMKVSNVTPVVTGSTVSAPLRCDHSLTLVTISGVQYLLLYGGKSLVAVPGYEGDETVGYQTRRRFKYSREVYTYNIANKTWTLYIGEDDYGKDYYGRAGHSATLYNNKLFIFGGDAYLPDYQFEGYTGANIKVNDTIILDIASKSWSRAVITNTGPSNRTQHATFMYNNKYMFVFGGLGSDGPLNDLWYLNLATAETSAAWTLLQLSGSYPSPRYSIVALPLPNNEVLFWGGTGDGYYARDLLVLNLDDVTAVQS